MPSAPLFHRSCCLLLLLTACGGDKTAGNGDGTPADTRPADTTTAPPDSAPPEVVDPDAVACCPVGTCADSTKACVAGACVPKKANADACYFDGECKEGKSCIGATFCACGASGCTPAAGTCGYPGGDCCNSDGQCSGGDLCIAGTCRPAPAGGCWRDGQCPAGEVCEGAAPVPCGQDGTDVAGHCGIAGVCCGDDAECGDGLCRGGRCVERASDGRCWGDGECAAGEACLGLSLCACTPGDGSLAGCALPPTPGRCGVAAESCCASDADCGDGRTCVEGTCAAMPRRALDECWVDGHCGTGRFCEGANLCGCDDEDCQSVAGDCRTRAVACSGDGDCPVAMRCVVPDPTYCTDGVAPSEGFCVERVDIGCWDRSECTPEKRCAGETVCRDAAGCEEPNVAGECRDKARRWDCCDSHDDCLDGYECRNADSSLTCPPTNTAVCLAKSIYGETCWNFDDCPDGLGCYRVWICGCNGKCYFNHQGNCEVPSNCQVNSDCGDGYVCAIDPECFLSPCTTAATCQSGGQCQVKFEGGCWTHDECGEGRYCEGLRICPPDTECTVPDQPGVCADRADLGECCTSFKGCKPGLRCLSPAARSGCKIDNTSVCVPAVTPGISCFGDEDCDEQQRCEGASVCPCGVETCDHAPAAGQCVAR